jgi:hypothetical protein
MVENGEITEAKNYTENTIGGLEAFKQLAATAYAEGDVTETERLLNKIDSTAAENEHEASEKTNFLVLYNLLNEKLKYETSHSLDDSLEAGKRHLSITDEEAEVIRTVAATETRIALQAKKLLYLYKGEEFGTMPEPIPNEQARTAKKKEDVKDEPIVKQNKLTVYPNPTNGAALVEFSTITATANFVLYNYLMQQVFTSTLRPYETKVEIPNLSLPQGIYLCTITENTGKRSSIKLIITKQ